MRLSPQGIKEFLAIANEDYGVELREAEAAVRGTELLLLYELISQPLPSERAAKQQSSASGPEQAAQ